jgi:hypothetical protein
METPMLKNAEGEKGQGFGLLPEALSNRRKVVKAGESTVVVEKWSAQKLILIINYVSGAIAGLSDSTLRSIGTDARTAATSMISVLGEKVLGLVELSVRLEDRAKIKDMDGEEFLDVLEAVMDLNLTESFIKKVKGLMAKLKPLSTGNGPNTQSK